MAPPPTKKRRGGGGGRWDSSSDEEDEVNASSIVTKKRKTESSSRSNDKNENSEQTLAKTSTASSAATAPTNSKPSLPLHNPLWMGCRSVYDTYERLSKISEGTYGIVWKARDLTKDDSNDNDNIVALKQIKFDSDVQKLQGFPVTALREINVLMALYGHDNLVSVKEMVIGSHHQQVYMVMECYDMDLCEAMTLRTYPNDVLQQGELKSILQQILRGMAYMHSKWFMHRDMKTSNILVRKRDGRVALCDLGLARRYEDPPCHNLTHPVVTLYYRSPELLFGETHYTTAVDMWSIGCIFGELIVQHPIMTGQGELDQIDKIFTTLGTGPTPENWPTFTDLPTSKMFKWRPKTGSAYGEEPLLKQLFPSNPLQLSSKQTFLDTNGYDLLTKMLTLDPSQRITAQDALDHPYFSQGVQPSSPNFRDQ